MDNYGTIYGYNKHIRSDKLFLAENAIYGSSQPTYRFLNLVLLCNTLVTREVLIKNDQVINLDIRV